MASHDSAKKSIRKTIKQTAVNKSRLSRMKTFIKKADQLISSGADKQEINKALSGAQHEIMRGAAKNVWHKNKASRVISRLTKRAKVATGEVAQ